MAVIKYLGHPLHTVAAKERDRQRIAEAMEKFGSIEPAKNSSQPRPRQSAGSPLGSKTHVFKNILVYRLTQDMPFDAEALEQALATKPARPPASQELSTYGFVAPFGKGEDAPLVHVNGDFMLIAARRVEKMLPGSVVKDAVRAKVEAIEAEQLRKVYKKERDQIKDEVIQSLLPHAFPRARNTFALLMLKHGLIVVDCSSPRTAEDLLSTLREVIGSLLCDR